MHRLIVLLMAAVLVMPAAARAGRFRLDTSHTQITFRVPHLVVSEVEGRFRKFQGTFDYDAATGVISNVAVTIDAASVDTDEPDRDKDLRSENFFNAAKFPTLEFHARQAKSGDGKTAVVPGDLTIHGVTRPVSLIVESKGSVVDPWGNHVLVFTAHPPAPLNRHDFGLNWNRVIETGGVMVGDEVTIEIRGEAFYVDEPTKK